MPTTYTTQTIIDQRRATVLELAAHDDDRATEIADRLCERLGVRPYLISDDNGVYDTVWASDADDALGEAVADTDTDAYRGDGRSTTWIVIYAQCALDRTDRASTTLEIDPEAPDCEDGHEHEWESPVEVVGGLAENPGVYGHGGGVIMRCVCRHCGAYRVVDTWAQNRSTGEQGLTATSYEDADDRSLAWVESVRASESDE